MCTGAQAYHLTESNAHGCIRSYVCLFTWKNMVVICWGAVCCDMLAAAAVCYDMLVARGCLTLVAEAPL